MKRNLLVTWIMVVCLPLAGIAGGWAVSHRLGSGVVAVTNAQANSSWAVSAVMVRFDAGTNGVVTVRRESQGASYVLGACTFTGATNLVWAPDRDYSFAYGDVLALESTATNGVVQVMMKGD